MPTLSPAPLSMERYFTWHAESRVLSTEISNLPGQRFEQVYDDACDEGFVIRSHHTGREVWFAVHKEHRDSEGDLMYWELRPISETRDAPNVTVHVYND